MVSYKDDMKIIDPNNLIPDHGVIERVVKTHPFSSNLCRKIVALTLANDDSETGYPRIGFNNETLEAILYVAPNLYQLENFKYILYHELGHVADQLNPKFAYSESERAALSESENIMFREIWNLYIDARLNHYGHFRLTKIAMGGLCRIDGKLQRTPFSIEGKLLRHISFLRSVNIDNADSIVKGIWENPIVFRSYNELISLIK